MDRKKPDINIKILYVIIFAPVGVLTTLIGQYLNSIGFNGTQIGTITSIATACGIISQAFWGKRYTNSRDGRKVIGFICIAGAVLAIIISFIKGYYLFAFLYGLLFFFASCVTGLCDTMVLELNLEYGNIRLWGAVGFGFVVLLGGKIGEMLSLRSIFYIYAAAFVISALILTTVRNSKGDILKQSAETESKLKKSEYSRLGYGQLLKEHRAIQLIICALFIYGTDMANNTYFSFLYRNGGGTLSGFGIVFFLMIIAEAPFMGIAPVLSRKLGRSRIIILTLIVSILRFAVFALGPSYIILILLFPLHGFIVGVIIVEYMNYLKDVVNPRVIGLAVAAFYAIGSNGGGIICNLIGGVAMDYLGIKGAYGVFCALNLLSLILFFVFRLNQTGDRSTQTHS